MDPVLYALLSVLVVSLASLVGIATLAVNREFLATCIFALVALATGALFGDALLHLIPEAFAELPSTDAALWVLGGILFFFGLEQFLRWHHHHGASDEHEAVHEAHPLGYLVLTADGVHNFVDGALIAASYLVSIPLGIATTAAVLLHEIPQEIGDFALLVHAGFSRLQALLLNFASALVAVVGASVTLVIGEQVQSSIPILVALAAGSFLYIAGSDLVPELHKSRSFKRSLVQFVMVVVGIGIMYGITFLEGPGHSHGAHEEGAHTH